MRKIGLLSDTHGLWDTKFEEYFKDCDEIWHAGDIGTLELADKFEALKPFRAVFGNIDDYAIRQIYPEILRFVVDGVDVFMTHIGGFPGRYNNKIKQELFSNPPQLFISGHSHILRVMYDNQINCLHMNPGAAGNHGFHQVRTILRFIIDNGNIRDLEVVEIKRG